VGGALDGLRVVDFGQYLAGPQVAMMLGDLGAEVLRIDPPGGPRWRHPINTLLQRGKRSMVLNLKQSADQQIAQQLLQQADVVIESFRPSVMERLGLGAQAALASNSRLIYCSIPGFSAEDPRASWAAWEGVVTAAAGLYLPQGANPANYRGWAGADPVYHAVPMVSSFAAMIAGHSILAALIARERLGQGQHIEVPLFDAAFELIGIWAQRAPTPLIRQMDGPLFPPPHMGHYRCADGEWIHLCLIQDRHLQWFAQSIMPQDWIDDGMANQNRLRTDVALQRRAHARFAELFQTRTALEWERTINEQCGAPTSICTTTAQWLRSDEHARAIKAVIELGDPEYGPTLQAGYPLHMSKTPPVVQGPRRPLDADREAILAELVEHRSVTTGPMEKVHSRLQALAGLRVVDLTQVLAGPTSARILAEYGAEVVKINSFEDRQLGAHLYTNSGKHSILLNLKTPEGRDILWDLVERSAVFVQNFTRGVAERLGIEEAEVRRHNPEIIFSTVSAFGYKGFRGGYRGREELGQALTGMQMRWGGNEPMMYPGALCDYGAGNLAAIGTLAALYHRIRTGEGQSVHTSLAHAATYHQLPYMIDVAGRLWDEPKGQQTKGWEPLNRLYQAADRWLYLAALREGDLERLSQIEGLDGIHLLSGTELENALVDQLVKQPAALWVESLTHAGIGAHVLMDIDEVMEAGHVKARGLSIVRVHPGIGPVRLVGPSRRLSLTPARATTPVGPAGFDTRAVVSELGKSEQFVSLVEKGIVAEGLPDGAEFVGQFR
jgi:crotonobetainyl-CoA:carnitine CoA-transferase CaiB-like acyl-CoA transferase